MTQSGIARALVFLVVGVAGVSAIGFSSPQAPKPSSPPALRWWKGNLHSHTLNSDGDSTPDDVVRWYREHGYHFATITDHNYLTNVDGLNAIHGAADKFLVIRGEEVSDRFDTRPIHINGLDPASLVEPPGGSSVADVMQRMVDAIRAARGVPSVNHPNFGWAISAAELEQVQRTRLFEVFNGHPLVNNLGGGGVPGLEEVWDRILSSGKLLYGIAVDDAHFFKRPEDKAAPRPGTGWVHVRADRLEPRAIVDALERGDFYASTGVELQSVDASATALTIAIKQKPTSKYRIQFIGRQGRVLGEATASPASYRFAGDEGYVRAKVIESNGDEAWIQPVAVGSSSPR